MVGAVFSNLFMNLKWYAHSYILSIAAVSVVRLLTTTGWKRRGVRCGTQYIEKLFPRFIVNDRDFEVIGDTIYRVNSDGLRAPLFKLHPDDPQPVSPIYKKWSFDEHSGEWYRVKKVVGSNIIHDREAYKDRYLQYHSMSGGGRISLMVIGALVLVLLYFVADLFDGLIGWVLFACGGFGFYLAALVIPYSMRPKSAFLGPEPLQRKIDTFGPENATAPAKHPADDDLAYKPTA